MNPLYEYLIYLVLGLTIGGIIVLKLIDIYKKKDDIQIAKNLGKKKKAKLKESLESETGKAEEINEVRVPRQGELDLPDANEGKFIVLHLKAKLDNKPSFELLKQKITANGLDYKNGYFENPGKNSIPSFLVLNGEEPATFSDNSEVKVITIALHLKGQRNVEKTFNKMLELGRSIADAWDMKLCDESFNTISEQRISEYKNEAHEVDLKNGSYGG